MASGHSNGTSAEVPAHQGYPAASQAAYPNPSPVPPAMRQYRSTSASSSRTTGYYSSPVGHPPPQMSPSQNGMPQQQHSEHAHRSGLEAMPPSTADHRSSHAHPHDQYAGHHAQYPYPGQQHLQQSQYGMQHPGSSAPSTQQHPSMPPPTSLPPFSALVDAHNGHRPGPMPLHVQTGQRPPFGSPPSTVKSANSSTSPVNGYNGVHGSNSHQYQAHPGHYAQAASTSAHHGYSAGHPSHYHDSMPIDSASKHSTVDPLSSSNVTSADSSDDEGGPSGLPAHGMIAPFVAIRGLADVADRVVEVSQTEQLIH